MQTKETKEKKSKKTVPLKAGQFFSSWSIYEELLGQYNSFSPGPE
jgi:hypothetical protein